MGVFDWFRRSAKDTGAEPGVSEETEHLSTSVGVIVEERPAAACCVPAQEPVACCGGSAAAEEAEDAAPAALATVPKPAGSDREPEGEHDMGLLDTIKEKLAPHHDKVEQGVDKAADVIDEKTGGKYSGHIDKGAEQAKSALGADGGEAAPEAAAEPPADEARPEENPPA